MDNMNLIKLNWKKTFFTILIALVIYSFLPLTSFWFMTPALRSNNNQANIERLKNNKGEYFSFIVFGDNRSGLLFNDASTLKLIWHMNREDRFKKVPIDFVLNTGDITLWHNLAHIKAYKKMQKLIKWPLITVFGNHEDPELFEEFVGEKQFAFVNRNSYFIIINNGEGSIEEKQFKWFEDHLKEGQKYEHIFVAMHKPPFDPYQQSWKNTEKEKWTYKVRKLCEKYNVDMVFSGDVHMFKHEKLEGVDYIVTAGGGILLEIPEVDGGYLHYIRVMVNHDYVTYEVRKVSPPLWLHITYYLGKEALYWIRNWYGSGYIFGRNTRILEQEKIISQN